MVLDRPGGDVPLEVPALPEVGQLVPDVAAGTAAAVVGATAAGGWHQLPPGPALAAAAAAATTTTARLPTGRHLSASPGNVAAALRAAAGRKESLRVQVGRWQRRGCCRWLGRNAVPGPSLLSAGRRRGARAVVVAAPASASADLFSVPVAAGGRRPEGVPSGRILRSVGRRSGHYSVLCGQLHRRYLPSLYGSTELANLG